MTLPALIASVLLFATLTAWFGIDAYLIYKKGETNSISWITAYWSARYPIIVFVIGMILGAVAGHLWWPNHEYCT